MPDNDLIRRGDAEEAAHEADSLELAQHGARLIAQRIASLPAVTAVVKRVVDLLDDLTERQWVIDGLTMSELKEITEAIGAVREVQSHKSK